MKSITTQVLFLKKLIMRLKTGRGLLSGNHNLVNTQCRFHCTPDVPLSTKTVSSHVIKTFNFSHESRISCYLSSTLKLACELVVQLNRVIAEDGAE